jgi:hypothetical protein
VSLKDKTTACPNDSGEVIDLTCDVGLGCEALMEGLQADKAGGGFDNHNSDSTGGVTSIAIVAGDSQVHPTEEELRAAAVSLHKHKELQRWYYHLQELYKYKAKHGDCVVPQKYSQHPSLGQWVGMQRAVYKEGKMSKARIDHLTKVGFQWEIKKFLPWDTQYQKLLVYYHENGHCKVPGKHPLYQWVYRQHSECLKWKNQKDTSFNLSRFAKLDKINFWTEEEKTFGTGIIAIPETPACRLEPVSVRDKYHY